MRVGVIFLTNEIVNSPSNVEVLATQKDPSSLSLVEFVSMIRYIRKKHGGNAALQFLAMIGEVFLLFVHLQLFYFFMHSKVTICKRKRK